MNKKQKINELMKREGWDEYTDDPNDRGGPTKWGVTEEAARRNGYQGEIKDMPYSVAFKIYSSRFWDDPQIDAISEFSEDLAEYVFDFGVNSGTYTASVYLQRILNVLNRGEKDYPDLMVDGVTGLKTLYALQAFKAHRGAKGVEVLADVYNGIRISFLFDLSENDESQEKYTYGWFKRVVEL